MKAIIDDFSTDIYQTDSEVKELCCPGNGADTCSWLLMGPNGWECCCLNKPYDLLDRHMKGQLTAMRDGCDKVNNFHPYELDLDGVREIEF